MNTAVYVVTDPGVPAFGSKGCSVHVQEVLRELIRRYGSVQLVTIRPGGDPPADLAGVVVHELPLARSSDLADREAAQRRAGEAAGRVVAELCAGDVALVYERYALWSALALEAARAAAVPTVLEINAPLVDEQGRHRGLHDATAARRWTARALAAADAPFAVAGPVARWAEALDPRRRIIPVVPNGVDLRRFTPAPFRPDATAQVVAFAGTFKPWHGTELLVDAVAAARARGAALRLLLIGDGPQLPATFERAGRAGVPVHATGRLDPAEVPKWLQGADLAAAPYPEGEHYFSPLKVAEYLAAGLPTVAGAIADLPGLVADGEEALLVPPGDVTATAAALARLARDPGLRAHLSVAGRRAAEQRMSWSAVVDATLALVPTVPAAREVG
jgi:glycosyltransferase involved in cell wall biosynthesis